MIAWDRKNQSLLDSIVDNLSSVEHIDIQSDTKAWIKQDGSAITQDIFHYDTYGEIASKLNALGISIRSKTSINSNDEEFYAFLMRYAHLVRYDDIRTHKNGYAAGFSIINRQGLSSAQKRIMKDLLEKSDSEACIDILDNNGNTVGIFTFNPIHISFNRQIDRVLGIL